MKYLKITFALILVTNQALAAHLIKFALVCLASPQSEQPGIDGAVGMPHCPHAILSSQSLAISVACEQFEQDPIKYLREDIQKQVLQTYAFMTITQNAAATGAVWTRNRKPEDRNSFDNEASFAAERASGEKSTRKSLNEAAALVSADGMNMASSIARNNWANHYRAAMNVAKIEANATKNAGLAGIAAAKESWRFLTENEQEIEKEINRKINNFNKRVNLTRVLELLRTPLKTNEFIEQTLPEVQEYYKKHVALIENKIQVLQMLKQF